MRGTALYPLEFLPRKADNYMNSTFANLPRTRRWRMAITRRSKCTGDDACRAGLLTATRRGL